MPKAPKEYDVDEVCLFLNAIGLGAKAQGFRDSAVDGDVLVTLSQDDLKSELGLNAIQARKVAQKLKFAEDLAATGGASEGAKKQLEELKKENAKLKAELDELKKNQSGDAKKKASEKSDDENSKPAQQQQQPAAANVHHYHVAPMGRRRRPVRRAVRVLA